MADGSRDDARGETFDRLLEWLDSDRDRAGERYEAIRRKLVKFFEWNGIAEATELADRTFDRVGRKLLEGGLRETDDPSAFCQGVARNILKEHWADVSRRRRAEQHSGAGQSSGSPAAEDSRSMERRLVCLERCLSRLSAQSSELILAYYRGSRIEKIENRKALARRLGIPMNALWIRSHRLRMTLEQCVEKCLRGPSMKSIDGGDQ